MLLEITSAGPIHVLVADLAYITSSLPSQPIRSFTTSEQLLSWIKIQKPGNYLVIARVRGEQIANYPYSISEGDVICGETITVAKHEIVGVRTWGG